MKRERERNIRSMSIEYIILSMCMCVVTKFVSVNSINTRPLYKKKYIICNNDFVLLAIRTSITESFWTLRQVDVYVRS